MSDVLGTSSSMVIGIGCGALCAVLAWFRLSKTAIGWRLRRIGIDPDGPPPSPADLTEKQLHAYFRYLESGAALAILIALSGLAALFLLTLAWPRFSWVILAACAGLNAWMLDEWRKRKVHA